MIFYCPSLAQHISTETGLHQYTYNPEGLPKGRDKLRIGMQSSPSNKGDWTVRYYYLKDHLGSTRVTLNQSGGVAGDACPERSRRDDDYPFGLQTLFRYFGIPGRISLSRQIRDNFANRDDEQKACPDHSGFTGHFLESEGGLDIYHAQARMYDPVTGRFWSVDAMRSKYPSLSSYVYVANNPLMYVDPDGMDIWEINRSGEIVDHIVDDTQDAFHIVDSDEERVEGASIVFEYGTVEAVNNPTDSQLLDPETGEPLTHTLFEITGDDNASAIFEFFANPENTNVEWTQAEIGTSESGRSVIGTSHISNATGVGSYLLRTNYTLRSVIHNHPSGNISPSLGDWDNAELYQNRFPRVKLYIYVNNGGTKSTFRYDDKTGFRR